MNRIFLLSIAALMALPTLCQSSPRSQVHFIGCKSDGQMGPQEAPTSKPKIVAMAPAFAKRLAYYRAADGIGVLAPLGWYCAGTYGANGASLYIAPVPITPAQLLSPDWKGFTGSAIQLNYSDGGTSGRFEVAGIIARVFPAHKKFVTNVIAEKIVPASSFPFGPYPNDKLTYKSKEIVEYITPPNSDGLGTKSWLLKNRNPISGVAILTGDDELSLAHLSARLPTEQRDMLPPIIRQLERDLIKK
jgi:hypothetical protein